MGYMSGLETTIRHALDETIDVEVIPPSESLNDNSNYNLDPNPFFGTLDTL